MLFQGGATWTADLSLSGLINIPDGLAQYQPEFRHLLVDLNHINADELKGSVIIRAVLLALKASREGLENDFSRLFQLLGELADKNGTLPILRTVLKYICVVDNDADLTEYMRQVEAVRKPKLQEEAMSIAEQLITKGRQEGHQEGRQEGMLQGEMKTLLKILNKRFGSVSQTIKKQISTATASQLETWIDASLDADSLQQIFKA